TGIYRVQPDGTELLYASLPGVSPSDGTTLTTVRSDNTSGFTPGDIFLPGPSVNQHPTVVKVSNGGATVNNTWLTLSAVMGQTGAVYLDRTGVFDNNLLVLTSPMMGGYSGDLWEFDSAGNQVKHIGPISSQYFLPFPG